MGANFHDPTKLTNKTNSQNLLLTLRFRKLMGAIEAFSKFDGCNYTPLAAAMYSPSQLKYIGSLRSKEDFANDLTLTVGLM